MEKAVTCRDVDHGEFGGLDPLKICRVIVCFDPLKYVTFFHSKLLLDNSISFTS